MIERKNKLNNTPTDPDGLLQRIMSKLDMDMPVQSKRKWYHSTLLFFYRAPQVLLVAGILMLTIAVMLTLLSPAYIHKVDTAEVDGKLRVSFAMGHRPLLQSVSVKLNGHPLPIAREDEDYYVLVDANGELLIETETVIGVHASEAMTIEGVDRETPHLAGDELKDGVLCIHLTDGEGSGVDWENITAVSVATGEAVEIDSVDPEQECIYITLPEESIRIYVPDLKGNCLTAILRPAKSA